MGLKFTNDGFSKRSKFIFLFKPKCVFGRARVISHAKSKLYKALYGEAVAVRQYID